MTPQSQQILHEALDLPLKSEGHHLAASAQAPGLLPIQIASRVGR